MPVGDVRPDADASLGVAGVVEADVDAPLGLAGVADSPAGDASVVAASASAVAGVAGGVPVVSVGVPVVVAGCPAAALVVAGAAGVSTCRTTVKRLAITPARSAAGLGVPLLAVSVPALGVGEAGVLRRGFGLSPVSFWPSASAVRATWSSSTLANAAGGPVAGPGGPFAAAPGSVWAPTAVPGACGGIAPASVGTPGAGRRGRRGRVSRSIPTRRTRSGYRASRASGRTGRSCRSPPEVDDRDLVEQLALDSRRVADELGFAALLEPLKGLAVTGGLRELVPLVLHAGLAAGDHLAAHLAGRFGSLEVRLVGDEVDPAARSDGGVQLRGSCDSI